MGLAILVIEDDPDIREVLEGALTARGFTVLTAWNGRDALEVVHRTGTRPAAIVLDLLMPEMNGTEFLEEKGNHLLLAGVPTVIVTAQPDAAPATLPATVKAILHKPVSLPILLEKIRDACATAPRPPTLH